MIRPMVGQPPVSSVPIPKYSTTHGRGQVRLMSHSQMNAPRFAASDKSGGFLGWIKGVFTDLVSGNLFKDDNVETLSRWLERNKMFVEQGDCKVLSKKTGESRYDTKSYHIELGGEEYFIERTEDAKVDWQIKYSIINVERDLRGELEDEPLGVLEYIMQRSCSSNGKNGNFVSFKHRGYACNIEHSKNPKLIEKTEALLEALSKVLDGAPNS